MIQLLVDSSADFCTDEIKENQIHLVPLGVNFEQDSYLDGVNLFKDEFYEKLCIQKLYPKTSQPSPAQFLDIFEKVSQTQEPLICLLLSSALSGTYQSACLAKNMGDFDNVYLIDTLSATVGTQMLVHQAINLIHEGKDATTIVASLEEMKKHIKIFAALDTLEYLCKGGRVSKTTATIGELASIKPIITVNAEGKVEVIAKKVGVNKTTSYLVQKMQEFDIDTHYPIYSLFSFGSENCEKMEKKVNDLGYAFNGRQQIGPTIGTHIGPGAFGVCFVEKY